VSLRDTLRLGAYTIRREYLKKLPPDPKTGEATHGFFDSLKQRIYIITGLHPDRERVIRCHESLHLIAWEKDLHLDDDLEERIVTALSEGLCALYPKFDF
jgi:hypothetical protein